MPARIIFSLLMLTVLLSGCTQFLFQPHRQHYMTPDILGVIHEDIYLTTKDGISLHGWKLLAGENSAGSVLFFHGNAENISTHFAAVHWLTEYGYDVYLFDYRGYGKSAGLPQLDAIIDDARTMIAYTVEQLSAEENLSIVGHSLGASIAIHAAARSDFKDRLKLVLSVEAFSDYHDVARDVLSTHWLTWLIQWPMSFTVDNTYRPLDVVAEISPVPLFIMHSDEDEVIPLYHAEALYAAARQPKQIAVIKGSHSHVLSRSENRTILLDFLRSYQ